MTATRAPYAFFRRRRWDEEDILFRFELDDGSNSTGSRPAHTSKAESSKGSQTRIEVDPRGKANLDICNSVPLATLPKF
jgi:hypothetical protein